MSAVGAFVVGKLARLGAGLVVGSALYLMFAVTVYHGLPSVIFQPILALGLSSAVVIVAFIAGLPLRILTRYRPRWFAMLVAAVSLVFAFALMCFPMTFLFMFRGIAQAVQGKILDPEWVPVYFGYFVVIFVIVNWPQTGLLSWGKGKAGPTERT